jgi:hypothetical protein
MKGSRFAFLIAGLAVAAFANLACATNRAVDVAVSCWQRTQSWFVDRFDWLVSKITPAKPEHLRAPRVALLGAVQYLGRMIRRDRPVVSPRWRMCPSV